MAQKKVEKTGVYRDKSGNAVYLTEGSMVDEVVLQNSEYDAGASKDYVSEPERDYFGRVVDAPQDQKAEDTWSDQRMVARAPENKAMPVGDVAQRSDAELANDAAKSKK